MITTSGPEHEHVIAKSLLSAGLSWPGVLLAEDLAALDILCACLACLGERGRRARHSWKWMVFGSMGVYSRSDPPKSRNCSSASVGHCGLLTFIATRNV